MSASIIRCFGFGRFILLNETITTKLPKQKAYLTCVWSAHTAQQQDNRRSLYLTCCTNNNLLNDLVSSQFLQSVHRVLPSHHHCLHTSDCQAKIKTKHSRGRTELAARLDEEQKIQVFGVDDSELMSIMQKSLARMQAQKGGLKLVVVDENAEPYPIYRLIRDDEGTTDHRERKKPAGKKVEKSFQINLKISNHDLDVKLKHMREYLNKGGQLINVGMRSRGKMINPEAGAEMQAKLLRHIREQLSDISQIKEASRSAHDLQLVITSKQKDGASNAHANINSALESETSSDGQNPDEKTDS